MSRTLKDVFEVYKPKSKEEQNFVDKHVTIKHKDRNGNDDDVFKGNTKYHKRSEHRKGYDAGDDEAVYEAQDIHYNHPEMIKGRAIQNYLDKQAAKKKKASSEQDYHGGYKSYKHSEVLQKINDGEWESHQDVEPNKLIDVKRHDKRGKREMIHVREDLDEEYKVPDGYHVTGGKTNANHGHFKDSNAAIRVANRLEDKTGYVHHVHHVKGGKIQKSWMFSDSQQKYAPHTDFKGEDAFGIVGRSSMKENWSAEDIDALLEQAFETIEEGLTEEELAEALSIAESLQEEFDDLDQSEAYSIAVATVTGIDLDEAEELGESLISGTRLISKHEGKNGHHAEIRYNKDYDEYSVHHYRNGKHLGEGPVSYHSDKAEAKDQVAYDVKHFKESVEQVDEKFGQGAERFDARPEPAKDDKKPRTRIGAYLKKRREKQAADNIAKLTADYASRRRTHAGSHGPSHMKYEEAEQIDELSKKTLGNYIRRAHQQDVDDAYWQGTELKPGTRPYTNFDPKNTTKREKGIKMAVKKLTKEDIINRTIERYIPEQQEMTLEQHLINKLEGLSESNISDLLALFESLDTHNRLIMFEQCDSLEGINKLLDLCIEARGQINELSKKTLISYVSKATHSLANASDEKRAAKHKSGKYDTTIKKRVGGIMNASKRLKAPTREDTE